MTNQLPIKVADGQITDWHGTGDKLSVSLIDWQEKPLLLSFGDVAAVLAMSPTGLDLSHLETSDDDPLRVSARELADNDGSTLVAFRFVSAWDSRPVLTVIASSLSPDPAPSTPRG
jgi:hypothetical protein